MRNVLAETLEEASGRLTTVCIDSHPYKVDFIDWVILVSILSRAGIMDLCNSMSLVKEDDDCFYSGNKWSLEIEYWR